MSIRRALSGPGGLFVWVDVSARQRPAVVAVLAALATGARHPAQTLRVLDPVEGDGVGVIAICETAGSCREAWTRTVCSPAWRRVAPRVGQQPTVVSFAVTQLAWAARSTPVTLSLLTGHHAEMMAEAPPPPQISGAEIWSVIGHPRRLLLRTAEGDAEPMERAEAAWAPLSEPVRRWSGLEKSPH